MNKRAVPAHALHAEDEVQPAFEVLLGSSIRPNRFVWPNLGRALQDLIREKVELNNRWTYPMILHMRHCPEIPKDAICVVQRYRISEVWEIGDGDDNVQFQSAIEDLRYKVHKRRLF